MLLYVVGKGLWQVVDVQWIDFYLFQLVQFGLVQLIVVVYVLGYQLFVDVGVGGYVYVQVVVWVLFDEVLFGVQQGVLFGFVGGVEVQLVVVVVVVGDCVGVWWIVFGE